MEQGKVAGFLKGVEDAEKLSGLVEDVRDAMMDYQVLTCVTSAYSVPNAVHRPHCSKISMTRVAGSS